MLKQILEVIIDARNTGSLGERSGLDEIGITEGDQFDGLGLPKHRQVSNLNNGPRADDAETQRGLEAFQFRRSRSGDWPGVRPGAADTRHG